MDTGDERAGSDEGEPCNRKVCPQVRGAVGQTRKHLAKGGRLCLAETEWAPQERAR